MSYKALYRTYRPASFDEVAGQKHIVKTLKNALKENKIAHAYLFCGPRGTGKTSMARIFAKALNCDEGFGMQCNECENCKAIIEGRHPDVIEIDAASNRGIDDIRDLISKVKYSPIMGRYKIYIIDEVHMMTTEAFNALLKTLEEPPAEVVFILATTEPYKLMPTILSRCQRYDFTKVADGDIYNKLFDICQNENVDIEEDALSMLVSLCDGGVRDALSMLDQAIAYCGNKISVKEIQELYGISSIQEKISLLQTANRKDVLALTNQINRLCEDGIDIKRLTIDLLDILKDLLIYQTTKEDSLLKYLKRDDCSMLDLSTSKINGWIDILLKTNSQYRLVNNLRSLFEISMLKLSSFEENVSSENKVIEKVIIKEVEKPVEEVKEDVKPIEVTPTVEKQIEKVEQPIITQIIPSKISNVDFTNVPPFVEVGNLISYTMEDIVNIMVQATKESKKILNDEWGSLDRLLTHNRMGKYANALKLTIPRIVSKNAIVFESQYLSNVNKINLKENQLGLSKIIKSMIGEECIIIAMTREEYVESVKKFTNLQQANKLPEPGPINIDARLTRAESSKSQTAELADELINKEI